MSKLRPDPELIERIRSLPDKELGRLLRRSREFEQKKRPKTVSQASPRWTPEETALLGTRPDKELARLLDRTVISISLRRSRLKIPCPNPSRHSWTDTERGLLGTMSDADVSLKLGLPELLVRGHRERYKIPVFDRKLHAWTAADDKLLGKVRDEELAKRFGVTVSSIKHRRTRLRVFTPRKLRLPKRTQRPWTPEEIALLGKENDRVIAKRIGRWVHFVRWKREELGITTPFRKRWRPEEVVWLGKLPDAEVAKRTGRSLEAVALRRLKEKKSPGETPNRRWSQAEEKLLGTAPDEVIAEKLNIPTLMVSGRRRFLQRPAWEPSEKPKRKRSR